VATALVGSLVVATGRAAMGRDQGAAGVPIGGAPAAQAPVVVQPGETLWEIARAVVGPEGDPRPVVERIRQANGLDPSESLLPGTSLVVPAS
jgi:nucleoid-associated protein YgaU